MSTPTVSDLIQKVLELEPLISEHSEEAETNRCLSAQVYGALYDAGLFGMVVPREQGGLGLHPTETMDVWEAVARIDSAAAWNLVMNSTISLFAAWLPRRGAEEIFGAGIPTVAGALNPPAEARKEEGGWRISGRVPFVSGCQHAQWLVMPAIEMDGDDRKVDLFTGEPAPMAVFFPRGDARILDSWHTVGMRGSGSADISVEDYFVPDHRTTPIGPLLNPAEGFDSPLYRLWPMYSVLGEATVSIGVAAACVEAGVEVCRTKTPAYNVVPAREQQLPQYLLGKALAAVEASRDTLRAATSQAYEDVAKGRLLGDESKIRLQLAVCFAAEACAEAVRNVNDAVGSSAIRLESPFERYFRDAHVMTHHASKSRPRYASAARLMLGLENDWIFLSF